MTDSADGLGVPLPFKGQGRAFVNRTREGRFRPFGLQSLTCCRALAWELAGPMLRKFKVFTVERSR